jgi:hypothetical protein
VHSFLAVSKTQLLALPAALEHCFLVRLLHWSTVGEDVASGVGEEVLVGARVGDMDGRDEPALGGNDSCWLVGCSVGKSVGDAVVGDAEVGESVVGESVMGLLDGALLGCCDGELDGALLGCSVGLLEGALLGCSDGALLGGSVGLLDGALLG